jgi:threonine synthase
METGVYEKIVPSRSCISNAMNVGHPSNFARVIALFGGWMDEAGVIREMPDMERMKKELWAISISDDDTRRTIQRAWQQNHLLLEPHGAVGWLGLERYLEKIRLRRLRFRWRRHPAKFRKRSSICWLFARSPGSAGEVERKQEQYRTMANDYARSISAARDL